jgi:hypothetical protein
MRCSLIRPVMKLTILDSTTDPGSAERANEDAFGHNEHCAFVIDGATGLGGARLVSSEGSDAAWLAKSAAEYFSRSMSGTSEIRQAVEEFNGMAREAVFGALPDRIIEAWALPTASFQMIRVVGGRVAAHGLGDCGLWLQDADGAFVALTPLHGSGAGEREKARKALEAIGGLSNMGVGVRHPDVVAGLRLSRAEQNTEGGRVWTLGVNPRAGSQVVTHPINVRLPALGLLVTDGLSALVDGYDTMTPEQLVSDVRCHGFDPVIAQLRNIERRLDPEGLQFPRFKQSDDATGVLFEITSD